jgi:hypothetical protein
MLAALSISAFVHAHLHFRGRSTFRSRSHNVKRKSAASNTIIKQATSFVLALLPRIGKIIFIH